MSILSTCIDVRRKLLLLKIKLKYNVVVEEMDKSVLGSVTVMELCDKQRDIQVNMRNDIR